MKCLLAGVIGLLVGGGASYAFASREIQSVRSEVVSVQNTLDQCEITAEQKTSVPTDSECKSSSDDYYCICERRNIVVPLDTE